MQFKIWYMLPTYFSTGIMGYAFCLHKNQLPQLPAPGVEKTDTHVLLRTVNLPDQYSSSLTRRMEKIFVDQQGEVWSPNGEARFLIKSKGLQHTSMSVGDMIETQERFYLVDRIGFVPLNTEAEKAYRVMIKNGGVLGR